MSYRARHRRRHPIITATPPVMLVAAGLTIGAAQGTAASAGVVPAAVSRQLPTVAQPFNATPVTVPLDDAVITPGVPRVSQVRKAKPPAATAPTTSLPTNLAVSATAIPTRVLASYVNAAKLANRTDPTCDINWQDLAGIGYIESGHARSGGSSDPDWDGVASPSILGPILDGKGGVGAIPDTDGGRLDGNAQWDRAVGPMQFIPSTWAVYAADGNGDGVKDPEDIDDATLAAADYLCAASDELSKPQHLIRAIYAYNHSYDYVRAVLTVAASYQDINPAKLGINGLPKDHKKGKHRKHAAHQPKHQAPKHRRHPAGHPTPTPSPTHSASPTPSPTPTSTASPTPSPTPTPTKIHTPKPSPTPTPGGGHLPRH